MLMIKFSRRGKKNQPFFRIIVLEKSKDPWGDFLEDLGFLNPLTKKVSLKVDRIKHWISKGAQPTGSVHNLLVKEGVIKADKVKVTKIHKKKTEKEKEERPKPQPEADLPLPEKAKEEKKEQTKEEPQDKS